MTTEFNDYTALIEMTLNNTVVSDLLDYFDGPLVQSIELLSIEMLVTGEIVRDIKEKELPEFTVGYVYETLLDNQELLINEYVHDLTRKGGQPITKENIDGYIDQLLATENAGKLAREFTDLDFTDPSTYNVTQNLLKLLEADYYLESNEDLLDAWIRNPEVYAIIKDIKSVNEGIDIDPLEFTTTKIQNIISEYGDNQIIKSLKSVTHDSEEIREMIEFFMENSEIKFPLYDLVQEMYLFTDEVFEQYSHSIFQLTIEDISPYFESLKSTEFAGKLIATFNDTSDLTLYTNLTNGLELALE